MGEEIRMKKITCFARRGTECDCLEVDRCPGYKKCSFYKNVAQYAADREQANLRLRQMPLEAQKALADQYYDGEMPWAILDSEEYPSGEPLFF